MSLLLYMSGFQVGGTNTMTATVAGSVATITAGTYIHDDYDAGTLLPSGGYTDFPTAVKTAFDAATSDTFTVSFDDATGLYTVSRATNFTLAFSTAADVRLRDALGFSGNKSGANTYTSDGIPKYIISAAIRARSQVSNVYEPDGIVEEAVSDGGDAYGTTLRTGELLSDWTQAYESKAATFSRDADQIGSWCWQAFFAHHRGTHPFIIHGDNNDDSSHPLYKLRADGAAFVPSRVTSDDDTYWNIPFRCRDLGDLS
jgi:hypothetical protein